MTLSSEFGACVREFGGMEAEGQSPSALPILPSPNLMSQTPEPRNTKRRVPNTHRALSTRTWADEIAPLQPFRLSSEARAFAASILPSWMNKPTRLVIGLRGPVHLRVHVHLHVHPHLRDPYTIDSTEHLSHLTRNQHPQ